MTTPGWARAEWATEVAEPFRSDSDFWASVSASADALLSVVLAVAASVAIAVTVGAVWSPVPFVLPLALVIRAGLRGRRSAQRSRESFADPAQWRDAERRAVAQVFRRVLLRRRATLG